MENKSLSIVYKDDHIVAINKPHGLLVHRTSIAADVKDVALQRLRDQLGTKVYPIHRIDRKTSGVLLFAIDKDVVKPITSLFRDRKISKTYMAVIRGWLLEDEIEVDYPLTNDRGKVQEAITHFKTISKAEISVPFGRYPTSRYSLIEAYPETGRMHQIRKHLNHLRHPIIGDRPHGCNKQNKLWKERWDMTCMMLHASSLSFIHPVSKESVKISAPVRDEMQRVFEILSFTV